MSDEHGNNDDNMDDHHVYEIEDGDEATTYKYGMSGGPLNDDGTSSRAEEQVKLFNRVVGRLRFSAKVLVAKIKGRKKAKQIENQLIDEYEIKHGKRPRGNPPENKLLSPK